MQSKNHPQGIYRLREGKGEEINRQDLFMKTNLRAFKSWQNSEEVEQIWERLSEYAIPLDSGPWAVEKQRAGLPGLTFLSEAKRQSFYF